MTTPAEPTADEVALAVAIEAVTVALLAAGTLAEIKALLAAMPGLSADLLAKFASKRLDPVITAAIAEVARELPAPVATKAPPSAAKPTTTPSSTSPGSDISETKPKSTPQPVGKSGDNPYAKNDFVPTSIQDHVNAMLAKKGKVRPKPKAAPAASTLVKQRAAVEQAAARAAYAANASKRLGAAYSTGDEDTIAAANETEDRYRTQHDAAAKDRQRAVRALAKQLAGLKPDANGEVLRGWYAHISHATCARCLLADGRNFDALVPPKIGWPGTVHPYDHCTAGKPHVTTERVEDVDPEARAYGLTASCCETWADLRGALLSEGVPDHQAAGLATIIYTAVRGRETDMIETRTAVITEVRGPTPETPDAKPGFTARAVQYGVPDTYNTSWKRGVFDEVLEQRMPSVVWCHDWSDPVGRVVGYRDVVDGGKSFLELDVDLDDFDAVPRARQAHAQVKSGSMGQFSFAFRRGDEEQDPQHRGVMMQTRVAGLDEFSIVLNGSVPGTHVTAVRTAAGTLDAKVASDLVTRFAAGQIELADALVEIRSATGAAGDETIGGGKATFEFRALTAEGTSAGAADPLAVLSAVDAAMSTVAEQLNKADVEGARRFFNTAASRLSELQYLLGMVPGVTSENEYDWRKDAPAEVRTEDQKADDSVVIALLEGLSSRAAYSPRLASRFR